jgi:stage 0 sporulation protein B (sporulation initiation phosphotransferase)
MSRWKGIQTASAAVLIASLAGLIAFADRWMEAVFALLTLASMFIWVGVERKRLRHDDQAKLIRTINLHRHDWLNDLQILFGYISMKKYDNLQAYVDKIKVKIHHESHVSRLGYPELIVYILTFHTVPRPLSLEVEVEREIRLDTLPLDEGRFYSQFRELCEAFTRHAGVNETGVNVLSVGFDLEERHLLVDFMYQGVSQSSGLEKDIERLRGAYSSGFADIERELCGEKAVVTVRLPV